MCVLFYAECRVLLFWSCVSLFSVVYCVLLRVVVLRFSRSLFVVGCQALYDVVGRWLLVAFGLCLELLVVIA